jgi:sugar lactone lactonase YvrE
MSSTKTSVPEVQILMSGIVFGEQPRWHADRLWFSDWGPPEVIAVDREGKSEVILHAPSFPCCVVARSSFRGDGLTVKFS